MGEFEVSSFQNPMDELLRIDITKSHRFPVGTYRQ